MPGTCHAGSAWCSQPWALEDFYCERKLTQGRNLGQHMAFRALTQNLVFGISCPPRFRRICHPHVVGGVYCVVYMRQCARCQGTQLYQEGLESPLCRCCLQRTREETCENTGPVGQVLSPPARAGRHSLDPFWRSSCPLDSISSHST